VPAGPRDGRLRDTDVSVRQSALRDIPALAGVLARAFRHDPMVVWPFVTRGDLEARIRRHFGDLDGMFVREGWIHQSRDGAGVIALIPPGSDQRAQAIDEIVVTGMAALTPDGGRRYAAFWAWIEACHPHEPHWLLDQLAVEPAAQSRGTGSALIRFALQRASDEGLPLFLETGVARNVALYGRFGFTVTHEADAPGGGPHVWFMRRDPVPARLSGSG
jgi:GNAT superfamily N-acetyltransferase